MLTSPLKLRAPMLAVCVLIASGCAPMGPGGRLPTAPLPLGQSGLPETRTVERLAAGLYHHHIYRGEAGGGYPQAALGPWSIHVLEIDPRRYRGRLVSALAKDVVAGAEPTSAIANRHGALAAINGGFFVMKPEDGLVGEPAGIAVLGGQIRSEPTQDRPYLVLRDESPVSAHVVAEAGQAELHVRWGDGSRSRIDGVDRRPGLIRNCGVPGGRPTERPLHDVTCTNPDELIALTDKAGMLPDDGAGSRALLVHPDGRVEPVAPTARPIQGQILLVATGTRASELVGRTTALVDLSYRAIDPGMARRDARRTFAVNGGPLLIRRGAPVRREDLEGWSMTSDTDPLRATTVHNWVNRRNPRTAAGIAADGRIYLVVVDGRGFEGETRAALPSVGLTIEELRAVMAHLGARDAINLDGGGSTVLVVRGRLVNRPSDRSGERPVGDAILLLP